jgi:hypothetical protein
MPAHEKIALAVALVLGSAASALAADGDNSADGMRNRSPAMERAAGPVRLLEGREVGPNELYRVCVIDAGAGRMRLCAAGE